MEDERKTREQLLYELAEVRQELAISQYREANSYTERDFLVGIVATLPDPLVVLDANLVVVLVSQAFCDLFHTTIDITRGLGFFALANSQWDNPNLRLRLEQVLVGRVGGDKFLVDQDFEHIGRKVLLLDARQLRGEGTDTYQILIVIQDVTAKRLDEKSLREAMDVLHRERRLAAIGLMISGMTHELNNPLGVILGYSELALNEPISERVRHYIETIHEATQRAAKIVSNVLSFGAEGSLETQGVDVRAILERAVGLNRHELMADNINVTLRISPDLPAINIDPFIMLQAFLNIITNAWRAMKEAHRGGELVIHADRSADRVRVIFEDNGPGISPEHIGRIFDPFFTTKEVGEGIGLGLSVTHGIVRRHGGEIWAESVPGKGASIYVEIPIAPLYESEMAEPLAAELEQVAEIKLRVLIVNDEAAFRELLSISLLEDGRRVDSAGNAEEAWDMVQSQRYDCIILNLWMPWMNGQTLYYRIKEYSEGLAQSCIFVTGAHRSQGVQEFLAATGNPSLSKPFSLGEIRRLVDQTLGLDDI